MASHQKQAMRFHRYSELRILPMIRMGFLASALVGGALAFAGPVQAHGAAATSNVIKKLHDDAKFSANDFKFSTCQGNACTTQFKGVTGLHAFNNMKGINDWAGSSSSGGSSGGSAFDNYKFTYGAAGSYFGNSGGSSSGGSGNSNSAGNSPSVFDNYKFTYQAAGQYFDDGDAPVQNKTAGPKMLTTPVPEPATWMMMIFGFGVVGLSMRRRAMRTNFA